MGDATRDVVTYANPLKSLDDAAGAKMLLQKKAKALAQKKSGVVPEFEEDDTNLMESEAEEDLYERLEALLPDTHVSEDPDEAGAKLIFDMLDKDGNGSLTEAELKHKLESSTGIKDRGWDTMTLDLFKFIDTGNDGEINYEEFENWYARIAPMY